MEEQLKKVQNILTSYHQEHLIQFYEDLSEEKKAFLLNQILSIDFDTIMSLYERPHFNIVENTYEIEPLEYIDKSILDQTSINKYIDIGIESLKNGEIAVITLAGGQGSRLGFNGPKGIFQLDTCPKISLFEVICNYLKYACKKFNISIPWYIMTSTDNCPATMDYFKKNNFFNYPKEDIMFFEQDNLPIIDVNGKLILEETYKVKVGSNGNGNIFSALKKAHLLENMRARKIKWVFTGGIDNVLLNPVDPSFIGLTISSGNHISSKTIFKEDPLDPDWVFDRKCGKPAIVGCENFINEVSKVKDKDGKYLYRETNMLAHIFSIDALMYMQDISLPYHKAFKKNTFINYEGMKQVPESPNVYKFEQFIFDAFSQFDDITLLRVNPKEEFAPIKSFNGPYNPEIAKEMYEKNVLGRKETNF